MENTTVKKCCNCKFKSRHFRVGKITHYHCNAPSYQQRREAGEYLSAWETLVAFGDTCTEHKQS